MIQRLKKVVHPQNRISFSSGAGQQGLFALLTLFSTRQLLHPFTKSIFFFYTEHFSANRESFGFLNINKQTEHFYCHNSRPTARKHVMKERRKKITLFEVLLKCLNTYI